MLIFGSALRHLPERSFVLKVTLCHVLPVVGVKIQSNISQTNLCDHCWWSKFGPHWAPQHRLFGSQIDLCNWNIPEMFYKEFVSCLNFCDEA